MSAYCCVVSAADRDKLVAFIASLHDPSQDAPLSEAELELAIALLKEGREWSDGGDAEHMDWSYREGTFHVSWFDQGRSGTHAVSEADVRRQMATSRSSIRAFLRSCREGRG